MSDPLPTPLDLAAIRARAEAASVSAAQLRASHPHFGLPDATWTAASDALNLCDEVERLRARVVMLRTATMDYRKALGDVSLLLDAHKEFEAYQLIARTLDAEMPV